MGMKQGIPELTMIVPVEIGIVRKLVLEAVAVEAAMGLINWSTIIIVDT